VNWLCIPGAFDPDFIIPVTCDSSLTARADYDYLTCNENVVVRLSGAASQNRLEGSEADEAIMMP